MTDREAILTALAHIGDILATQRDDIKIEAVQSMWRLVAEAEPAAPTVTKEPGIYTGSPTVTREQAEWVSDVIQTKWYDIRAKQDDEREAPPVRYEMPAFFRAVADALDREG